MGIYSNSYVGQPSDYGYDETLESIMEDESVVPCESDDLVEAGLDYIQTMQENYNSIFMHIGQAELQALEESGQQMVYTEGVLSSIWNAIKSFIKKVWEKIKSLFKRFMMIIDSYTKNDKEFLNKYRKELGRVTNLTDFEFKGYKWNINASEIGSLIDSFSSSSTGFITDIDMTNLRHHHGWDTKKYDDTLENFDDWEEKERGEYMKKVKSSSPSSLSEKEFREELKLWFRNEQTEKETLDSKDIKIYEIMNELNSSADTKKNIKKLFTDNQKSIKQNEKIVDKKMDQHLKENIPVKNPDGKVDDPSSGFEFGYKELQDDNKLKEWIIYNTQIFKETDAKEPGWYGFHPSNSEFVPMFKKEDMDDQGNFKESIKLLVDSLNKKQLDAVRDAIGDGMKPSGGRPGVVQFYVTKQMTNKEWSERYTKKLSLGLKIMKSCNQSIIIIDTEALNAMKERSRQNKAICVKLIIHSRSKKEDMYLESTQYDFNTPSYRNAFDSITLK